MPPLNIEIQRCLQEVERAMAIDGEAQFFVWPSSEGPKEVPCVPSSIGREVIIDNEGNPVWIDGKLIVRREEFLTADSSLVTADSELYTADDDTPTPLSGMELTFRGTVYEIVTARESGPKSHFELTLKEAGGRG